VKIIKPGYKILQYPEIEDLKWLEAIGRIPYKSEGRITEDSYKGFLTKLIAAGHEAMIEFLDITVMFQVDRGVSHELVRHRLCSFAQESTRYCNYTTDKFGGEVTFIDNTHLYKDPSSYMIWMNSLTVAERAYKALIENGESPQIARGVLPNSLKTEIVMKANLREWRNIFKLRTPVTAHPQMREVMIPLLKELQSLVPIVFDDLEVQT